MSMLNQFKTVKGKVWFLLKQHPEARDDDALLYHLYLTRFCRLRQILGMVSTYKLLKIMRAAPPPESIRRMRQKIQEGGQMQGRRREQRMIDSAEVRNKIYEL